MLLLQVVVSVLVLSTIATWALLARALRRAEPAQLRKARAMLEELEHEVDDLHERLKTLHGRKAVAAKRARDADAETSTSQLPGETPAEWKARMRDLSSRGVIKLEHKR